MDILTNKEPLQDLHQENLSVLRNLKEFHGPLTAVKPAEKTLDKNETQNEKNEAENHSNVAATPENIASIDKSVRILELFEPHHPETRFQFNIHSETGTIQVKLINKLTGEVIEEIPSSKLLDFNARMEEITGLILEQKA